MTATGESITVTQPRSISWSSREPAVAAFLVAAFVILRSAGMGTPVPEVWAALASLVALVSPLAGFLAAVALGPFDDWPVLGTEAGGRAVLVAALALSVAVRLSRGMRAPTRSGLTALRPRTRSPLQTPAGMALGSAAVVLLGTGLGVMHTTLRFGTDLGYQAAQLWATGVGMALVVLFIGAWFGARNELRPVLVAAGAAVVGVGFSLVYQVMPAFLATSPLEWLIVVERGARRLDGILAAPNAMAMLALLPACLLVARLIHVRSALALVVGAVVMSVLAVGALATSSRSAVLAVAAVAVAYAWHIRRSAAIVMLVVAGVGAAVLVPLYVEQRAGTPLPGAGDILQDFFTAGDRIRSAGWAAAIRMALDSPLIGQGFRSYLVLHEQFGDAVQTAPHNEWLRLYAEQGIVVGTAGLIFLGAALTAFWRMRGSLALGAFGTLLAYAIMAGFNNPLNYAQLNIPTFAVLGVVLGMAVRQGAARAPLRIATGPPEAASEGLSGPAAGASKGSSAAGS
ncbi:MAG: O-antigen ligase family protein [Chloroflexota bacterium]|nr:O-antigen ligase family protein [Chloroflexota bacterium]